MCRLAGFWDFNNATNDPEIIIKNMTNVLAHGGPDSVGFFNEDGLRLGHRRLSIIDLSEDGNQPMGIEDHVIIFNGEIYNYQGVREELIANAVKFRTNSDTEVILRSWQFWGQSAVNKFKGMFAFAIWDRINKKLILCRDRFGVKPLYWYYYDGLFMFASELKSFHQHPNFNKEINHGAVSKFLQVGYINSPDCIYKNAQKLSPGSFLEISTSQDILITKYWDGKKILDDIALDESSEEKLIEKCERVLKESFNLRMVSDVPVGMFLSGGIDSSLLVAILQKEFSIPLKTFTIGFNSAELNEAQYAKKVASYLGTDHVEFYCSDSDLTDVLPSLPYCYDEPFGDSSSIPTILVSKLAKKEVKVSLSADGGDELFGGYLKYFAIIDYWKKIDKIPLRLRAIMAFLLKRTPNKFVKFFAKYLLKAELGTIDSNKIMKLINGLTSNSLNDFFYKSSTYINQKDLKKLHHFPIQSIFNDKIELDINSEKLSSQLGLMDIQSYLEGDILNKIDRATMSQALEGREPFLDVAVFEFAMSLKMKYKNRDGKTKWILRQVLTKYLPESQFERPKMGFSIPISTWMKTSLKNELLLICEDTNFCNKYYLNHSFFKKIINQFLFSNQTKFNPHLIWFLYCLYVWDKRWS